MNVILVQKKQKYFSVLTYDELIQISVDHICSGKVILEQNHEFLDVNESK